MQTPPCNIPLSASAAPRTEAVLEQLLFLGSSTSCRNNSVSSQHSYLADKGEVEAFLDAVCICSPPLATLQDLLQPTALSLLRRDQSSVQLQSLRTAYLCKLWCKWVRFPYSDSSHCAWEWAALLQSNTRYKISWNSVALGCKSTSISEESMHHEIIGSAKLPNTISCWCPARMAWTLQLSSTVSHLIDKFTNCLLACAGKRCPPVHQIAFLPRFSCLAILPNLSRWWLKGQAAAAGRSDEDLNTDWRNKFGLKQGRHWTGLLYATACVGERKLL